MPLLSGALLWFVVSELFFGFSANKVYAKALKKVKASTEVRYGIRLYAVFNPLSEPKVKPWVIQSFLAFDSMNRTHSLESC